MTCKGKAKFLEDFSKTCSQCENEFKRRDGEAAGNWQRRIYCSQDCAWKAAPPPTLVGEDNPHYKGPYARRKQPRRGQSKWRKDVLKRDKYTCQKCGDKDVPIVAHHILSWEDFPELRNDISNGLTLCNPCHFKEHGWNLSQAGVKVLVDERGIQQRRWNGFCLWCEMFITKQASDMRREDGTYRIYGFCDKKCATKAAGQVKKGVPKSVVHNTPNFISNRLEALEKEKIKERSS